MSEETSAPVRDLDLELQRGAVHARLFGASPTPPPRMGRFAVLRRLGAGGMGVVYEARDAQLDRRVALKLLQRLDDPGGEGTARLLREAQALARLSHPNVVQVHDVGEHEGRVFLTMEFVAGPTLRAWQAAARRGWRAIVDMYIQAGEGLAAAHDAGLVHRDFKPENVLVAADGRPRVLDFGLASLAGAASSAAPADAPITARVADRFTRTGARLGTPGYAAPELRGGDVTPRADQYSFCVSLYEALHVAPRARPGSETCRCPRSSTRRHLAASTSIRRAGSTRCARCSRPSAAIRPVDAGGGRSR
ncbi:MAG: serine/threonine-protein kinase [Nannocystaceae bacterium]